MTPEAIDFHTLDRRGTAPGRQGVRQGGHLIIQDLNEGMGLAITTERLQVSGGERYVCPQA
jgi:hypothetical protein